MPLTHWRWMVVSSEEQQLASSYFSSLNHTTKKCNLEKLKIGGFNHRFYFNPSLKDPFSTEDGQWSENLSQWPELEFGDIYGYLIDTEGIYTKEKLRTYKSLDAY